MNVLIQRGNGDKEIPRKGRDTGRRQLSTSWGRRLQRNQPGTTSSLTSSPQTVTQRIAFVGLPRWFSGKEPAWKAGDVGSIPGLGKSTGEGNGNFLQYSCLGNSMDRGAWWATVHGVAQSQTRLKQFSRHTSFWLLSVSCSVVSNSLWPHGL